MLIQLKIQNLILVDFANISFAEGLNIITGETGAGKSAILSAIRLITGDRSDTQLIGKNGDLAIIEAQLSPCALPDDLPPLEKGEPLWIRREIHRSGKSRCFANDSQISLGSLRQIVGHSIEIIGQSSSNLLNLPEEQRKMLDTYCNTLDLVQKLSDAYAAQKKTQERLDEKLEATETRARDLAWAEDDLALIEEISWQPNEDEALNQQHNCLTRAQEIIEKIGLVSSIITHLQVGQASSLMDSCSKIDPSLSTLTQQLKTASLEIDDVERSIHSYLNKLEADPGLLSKIEERIAKIEQIKRRFGKTHALVSLKKKELENKIDELNHLDQEILDLKASLKKNTDEAESLAHELHLKRAEGAPHFAQTVLQELCALNLPHAQFLLSLEDIPLSAHGIDKVRFLFTANKGHAPLPIEECASGGEMSRLLLAIKTVLIDKENNDCLIFDEIDSNVGGQTASILGEKLKTVARKKQVICVTHFVQVAKCATTHFGVMKEEIDGRTKTKIAQLSEKEKAKEYERMLGKTELNAFD